MARDGTTEKEIIGSFYTAYLNTLTEMMHVVRRNAGIDTWDAYPSMQCTIRTDIEKMLKELPFEQRSLRASTLDALVARLDGWSQSVRDIERRRSNGKSDC